MAMLLALGAATASALDPPAPRQIIAFPASVVMAEPSKLIGDFELVDQEGNPFRFSGLRGRPVLVFFGFTHCPDVCPATLVKMRLLADSVAQDFDLAIVMISVDGDRDKPAALKTYLAQVSTRFVGLTGNPRTVGEIAAQFPAVFFKGLADHPGSAYSVQHTSQVYLIDRDGRLRAAFYDAPVESMEQVLRDIK